MKPKQLVIYFFATFFALIIGYFSFAYVIDPSHIFTKNNKKLVYLKENIRTQAYSFIENVPFDSIILGTSMLENTSSKEASQALGGEFINISLSGSSFYERSILLRYIFKKQKIKTVVYSLDDSGLIDNAKDYPSYPTSNFNYLYDDNKLNDIKYYWGNYSGKYFVHSILCSFLPKKCKWQVDRDRPKNWIGEEGLFGGLDIWMRSEFNAGAIKNLTQKAQLIRAGKANIDPNIAEKEQQSYDYINQYLLSFVANHPKTTFILIVPAYSRMSNALDAQYDKPRFERRKASIRYLVAMTKKYPNMQIYGWGDTTYPDNIAHYKDLIHYHWDFNSQMLWDIHANKGRLTPDNVEQYLNAYTEKSQHYDILGIAKQMEHYLAQPKP